MLPEKLGGRTRSIEDFGLGREACLPPGPGAVEVDLLPGFAMPPVPVDLIEPGGAILLGLPALSAIISRFEVSVLFIAKLRSRYLVVKSFMWVCWKR